MKTGKIFFVMLFCLFALTSNKIFSQDADQKESLDPAKVIAKYIDAIGGRTALSKIEDRTTIMRGTAMGQSLTIIIKQKAPNKMRQELKAGGMEQLTVFDGEKGVMKAGDQKIEITGKELEQYKVEATLNLVLDPESFGIKLSYEGEEKDGEAVLHKVKFTLPSGIRWFEYFDTESGLKVKEEKEMQTQMGLIQQVIKYDNYTDVEGIKYPFKITQSFGPQSIEMTVSSVKVNKGLTDDLFVITE